MPLWGKTRCPVVEGWEERIVSKVAVAGAVGAAVGSVLSVLQQQPLVRFTASSAASFVLLAACFATLQETGRLVRCQDSPVNSAMAGAGTGALLYKSHGRPASRGAAICAGLGAGAHWALARVDAVGGLRNFLIGVDLLDPPAHAGSGREEAEAGQVEEEEEPLAPRPWWHAYLPVRKLSDAEWRAYRGQQDAVQQQRIDAALAGGLPAVLERRQRQPPPPQQGDGGGSPAE